MSIRDARLLPGFDARVEAAGARLADAAERFAGRIVQASSLGVEDMVVTDMIARARLPIAVATLETGKLHAETLALIDATERRYGLSVELHKPLTSAVVAFVQRNGEDAMYKSVALRKACCAMRKSEPLVRLLQGRDAWVTGLRRAQSQNRTAVDFQEIDDNGRAKLSPIADWQWADVWQYVARFDVPYNALHDAFYPSIGCEPCTRAVSAGEDIRAGRWWWEQEGAAKECGLHATRLELPPLEPPPRATATATARPAAASPPRRIGEAA